LAGDENDRQIAGVGVGLQGIHQVKARCVVHQVNNHHRNRLPLKHPQRHVRRFPPT